MRFLPVLLLLPLHAFADAIDETVVVERIVEQVFAITLVGSACIGVAVLIQAYRWLRRSLG